jgi:hypothetical protein
MIEVFEGRLGGGKSYSAVVRMVDVLRRGGVVCTNVEVVWDAIKAYIASNWGLVVEDDQLIKLDEKQIGLFHHHTPSGTPDMPVLVVIDEAHLIFNARDYSTTDKLYRETLTFLTQSRKVATDVIFISQSALNIDKQFARLVQYIWRFRDLSKWKIPGLGITYPFQQILVAQFDYDGHTMLNRQFIRKDPRIFALYLTNSLLRPFPRLEGVVAKRDLKRVENSERKSMVKILIPVGIIAGIIGAFVLVKKFKSMGDSGKYQPASALASGSGSSSAGDLPKTRSGAPSSGLGPERAKTRTEVAYQIFDEQFRGWYGGEKILSTDAGWYELGQMSNKGLVTAVSRNRARVGTPDGQTAWVIATARPRVETNGGINYGSNMDHSRRVGESGGNPIGAAFFGKVDRSDPEEFQQPAVKSTEQSPKTKLPVRSDLPARRVQLLEKAREKSDAEKVAVK